MTEAMRDKDIISKGPKKRDPASFQTLHAILIPAGTILRQEPGKPGDFTCPAAFGVFTIDRTAAEAHTDTYRKVVSA
jgi:hypothetical protein